MDKDMYNLYQEFLKIRKLGYVPSTCNYRHLAGTTFETLLGKEKDELFLPDYNGIEIKTKKGYSKSKITLFTANPDGKYVLSLQNLFENYSMKSDSENSLFLVVTSKEYKFFNHHYFKISVDREQKEVILNIYDIKGNLVENDTRWSFDLLNERLNLKLQKLALVKCCTKIRNKKEWYWYYKMQFYKDLNFNKFIDAIDAGLIEIKFTIGIFKSGTKKGKMHNHGTMFAIEEKDLKLIYDKIIEH